MPSTFQNALWFAARPSLYPHAFRLAAKKFQPRARAHQRTRDAATQWCAGCSVDTATALKQLGVPVLPPVARTHADVFAQGERLAGTSIETWGAANLDLLYGLCEHLQATRVIETGVAYGWSSLALLLSLKQRGGRLISTDMPMPGSDSAADVGCVVPHELRINRWSLYSGPDVTVLPRALTDMKQIDLCHYDSDKSYEGRMFAYLKLWNALRHGGIFVSDDVGDNLAFCDFVARVSTLRRAIVVHFDERSGNRKYIGILVKD